jgi:hypothetical protein
MSGPGKPLVDLRASAAAAAAIPSEPLAVSVVPGGVNPLWGIYDDMGVFQTMS